MRSGPTPSRRSSKTPWPERSEGAGWFALLSTLKWGGANSTGLPALLASPVKLIPSHRVRNPVPGDGEQGVESK